jgi:RNA polymerase sigma factor (TIGR02999 family)
MESPSTTGITQLLRAWGEGDQAALDKLIPLVQEELRQAAHRFMARERPGHTLQTTALVNEVYLRLIDLHEVRWQDRAHFFAICARLMRHILIDLARSRRSLKRGGSAARISLEEGATVSSEPSAALLALDDALNSLAAQDPRKSQVVELRFFGGLTVKESAQVLKVSEGTIMHDWKLARAWLLREMNKGGRVGA